MVEAVTHGWEDKGENKDMMGENTRLFWAKAHQTVKIFVFLYAMYIMI